MDTIVMRQFLVTHNHLPKPHGAVEIMTSLIRVDIQQALFAQHNPVTYVPTVWVHEENVYVQERGVDGLNCYTRVSLVTYYTESKKKVISNYVKEL